MSHGSSTSESTTKGKATQVRAADGTLLTAKHEVLERFREHFKALYNGTGGATSDIDFSFLDDDGRIVAVPTYEEVSTAITSLKNNKASGPDNLPAELLKMGGEELTNALYKIVLQIWNEQTLPAQWLEGATLPLHKKGDKMICENYRGITLLEVDPISEGGNTTNIRQIKPEYKEADKFATLG